jgi:tetratricopeptide (TPR) repeat protein
MRILSFALAGLIATAVATPVFAQGSAVEKARVARFAGRIDEAERQLDIALSADPSNYLALYNMGLIYEARAVRAPAGEARLRYYRTAANWLEKAFQSPKRASAGADAYTIFNSLGAMYLGFGDLQKADSYLQQGLKNEARLTAFSRGRLYGNVGYLYALQGDTKRARMYFAKGAGLGSGFAQENLRRLDAAGIR